MFDKIDDIISLYEKFLKQNNIYTEELFNYGVKSFKANGINCNYRLYTTKLKFYKNEWKDFYIRHSITYKLFIRYLKEKNIYHNFIRNLNPDILFLSYDFIISNFDWSNSYEGNTYWNNKSEEWNKLLSVIYNIN